MMTSELTEFAAVSSPLTLSLFGPMQVLVQGQPLPHLRSRKTLYLLALLTLRHDRPVEREWLAGTLWPDRSPDQGAASLRPILSELRQALGDQSERLQTPGRHVLELLLAGADVDVLTFDAAMVSKQPSGLQQAVTLYRGPLIEGCAEEWVFQERTIREQNCLHALQKLADSSLTAGDHYRAVGYWRQAVHIAPLWDTARQGLIEALARSGDINAALQSYREFVDLLKGDPKAIPDEKTTALYLRLRAEARQRARTATEEVATGRTVPVVTGSLSHALTRLVGREDERTEVAATLRRSRLVTLIGIGGIGKTRLAIEIASEIVREYTDGAWLVALEPLADSEFVARQIASVFGLKDDPGKSSLQTVTECLRKKQLLLILDNCEPLLEAVATVTDHLLRECASIRILATSREALGISGETVWSVPTLAVPDPQHLPQGQATLLRVLMSYESIQLFIERAQSQRKSFALTGSNARIVAQICSQLEGIPLAIELAAVRVNAMTVEQIAERLHDHLGFLIGGSRTAFARQQTLRGVLDWSYDLLSEPEQGVFRRLSVFTGGWNLKAAEQVCAADGIESGQIQDLLASLLDKALVVFEEATGEPGGRYRFLETIRQYATERLRASEEWAHVHTRYRDWCIT